MKTISNKRANAIKIAQKDLSMWLYYAGVKTVDEFHAKSKEIREKSFHKYNDVIDHIDYIKKLEKLSV